MATTTKLRLGATETWYWFAPEAATAATATFALDAGDIPLVLTPAFAPIAFVAAIDRRTLTAGFAPIMAGIQGEPFGEGWIVTTKDGIHPVVIARVDGTTVSLAEPLPRSIDAIGAVFYTRVHRCAVGPGNVTAAQVRNLRWSVEYTAVGAAMLPSDVREVAGLLDVVIAPWTSGLTHGDLVASFPGLAEAFPSRAGSWGAQIEAASVELQARLDADVAAGMQSDDIESNNAQLKRVHALMSAAKCVEVLNPDLADRWMLQAMGPLSLKSGLRHGGLYHLATKDLWLDENSDGNVDEGEVQQVTGPRASWLRPSSFRKPVFTIGSDDH